jgi:hypothetical protein
VELELDELPELAVSLAELLLLLELLP